ncbi:HET-domain-containing protein [Daldinia loculata]|nr:HET-domain-containing protein [Daldinia loculata]
MYAGVNIDMIYAPGNEESISCYLHTVPFSIDLKYTALSYLWGDQSTKEVITINGHLFSVGINLYKALEDLSQQGWSPKDSRPWVDAICINQDDNSEKSEQIPRIARIYRSASRVIVSIIATNTLTENVVKLLSDLADGLKPFGGDSWRQRPYALLRKLTRLPWFSRIWVRQEVTLAAEWPTIVIGKYQIHMLDLFNLLSMISNDRKLEYPLTGFPLHIILSYREAEATLPHDQVYGFLGQVYAFIEKTNSRSLPSQLNPDYTKPYEEVYHEFVAYIFEQNRDLRLLETTSRKLRGIPSWYDMDTPHVKANLKLSKSRRELQAEGIKISICQALLLPMPKVSLYVSHLRDRNNDIKEKIIKPSAVITNTPYEVLREKWFENISKDDRSQGKELYEKLLVFVAERHNEDLSKYRLRKDESSLNFLVLLDKIQVLFQNGNFGICNRHDAVIERGDILCLIERYVFVSSCKLTDATPDHSVRTDWVQQHHCEFFDLI